MVSEARLRERTVDLVAVGVVLLSVVLVSYWRVVNVETFMRLAIGRETAQGIFLERDPWIYSVPGLHWRNPEWLGDLLLYGVFRMGGEGGLVALKLTLLGLGWTLLYLWGRRAGGRPLVLVGLIMLALAGSEGRFLERNEQHLYWLLPAYGLVLQASVGNRRWLAALVPLGLAWVNLHGSFMVSWLLVGASLADALVGPRKDRQRARELFSLLLVHLLLPFASPGGLHAYGVVIDHYRHATVIKELVREWEPPDRMPATLARLPLHVLGIVGLLSFLPRPNRTQVQGFLLVAVGLYMAHGSLRFFLIFAMLAIPTIGANLARAGEAWPRVRTVAALVLALGSAALVFQAGRWARVPIRVVLRPDFPTQAGRWLAEHAPAGDFPTQAGRWLAEHAPAGSRLFGPYSGSQMLMWEAPKVGLYIDPHFSFSADLLVRYYYEVLPHPETFEAEARRFDINLAMVGRHDETAHLADHLVRSPEWKRVYADGYYAIFARRVPKNADLIRE
jgi:hypothetical protein